jgi:hypothetical protein
MHSDANDPKRTAATPALMFAESPDIVLGMMNILNIASVFFLSL